MDNHMFEAYARTVEIDTPTGTKVSFKMRPLSGRYLPKLFTLLAKMEDTVGEDEDQMSIKKLIDSLGEEGMLNAHELIFETLKKTYPKHEDLEGLDEFVTQNLFQLLPALLSVNVATNQKA